jgi:hypothetical protein
MDEEGGLFREGEHPLLSGVSSFFVSYSKKKKKKEKRLDPYVTL